MVTASMLMFGTMSIEPLVTAYVTEINGAAHATMWGGLALGAAGSIASAPVIGRLADRIGHRRVIVRCLLGAATCLIVQGYVQSALQLAVAQLALGVCLGGLMPSVTAALRHVTPTERLGRTLGLAVSAQYVGQVVGPVTGGLVAGAAGFRPRARWLSHHSAGAVPPAVTWGRSATSRPTLTHRFTWSAVLL